MLFQRVQWVMERGMVCLSLFTSQLNKKQRVSEVTRDGIPTKTHPH